METGYFGFTDNGDLRMHVIVYRGAHNRAGHRLVCSVVVSKTGQSTEVSSLIETN
jgi:hypothetical protein